MTELELKIIELAEVTAAISAVLIAGQSYTMTTASGGGSSRIFIGADIKELREMKKDLRAEIALLENKSAVVVRAGW